MPISPSSSAHEARKTVASRLRELRKEAGLTVVELAGRCGWHHAKTSRVKNAKTPPSPTGIRRWCSARQADNRADGLIAASRDAESMYLGW